MLIAIISWWFITIIVLIDRILMKIFLLRGNESINTGIWLEKNYPITTVFSNFFVILFLLILSSFQLLGISPIYCHLPPPGGILLSWHAMGWFNTSIVLLCSCPAPEGTSHHEYKQQLMGGSFLGFHLAQKKFAARLIFPLNLPPSWNCHL